MPAAHRHGFPFWCDVSQRAGAARRRSEGLRARCRQRQSHPIAFLPELRHHPLLGRGPQPSGLRSRSGCVRHVSLSAAQRLDLGGVDVSMAWSTAAFGAPPARPTTGHVSRFSPNAPVRKSDTTCCSESTCWLQKSGGDCCIADSDRANSVLSLGTGRSAAPDRKYHRHGKRSRTRPVLE